MPRWFSTNTRTLDFASTLSETSAGMSYRGPKSTTFNGIECLPWGEVFSRCTKGFKEENLRFLKNKLGWGSHQGKLGVSSYLSHMSPDLLGLKGKMTPSGLFDVDSDPSDVARGHNECRTPSFREAWLKSQGMAVYGGHRSKGLGFMPGLLATSGPFCFVDAADPRAANFTKATG